METPDIKPGHCATCGRPIGQLHALRRCGRLGFVRPEEAVQLGGVAPVRGNGRLPLFLYGLIRDGSPGAIERATLEAEAHSDATVSNPYLWEYALNLAGRLNPREGGDLVIVQMPASSPRDDLSDLEMDPNASMVVAVWPGGDFRVLQRGTSQAVRIQGVDEARSVVEGLLHVAEGTLNEHAEENAVRAAREWLGA